MFVAYKIKHEDLSTLTATFHSLAKPTHYIQIILNLCTLFAHLSIRTLQMMLYVALCMARFIYFYNFLDLFCNGKRWISTCIYLCCIGTQNAIQWTNTFWMEFCAIISLSLDVLFSGFLFSIHTHVWNMSSNLLPFLCIFFIYLALSLRCTSAIWRFEWIFQEN